MVARISAVRESSQALAHVRMGWKEGGCIESVAHARMRKVIGSSHTGNWYWLAQRVTPLTHPAYQRPGLGRPFRGVKLPGDLIFRQVSRLDAFSGYLFRI